MLSKFWKLYHPTTTSSMDISPSAMETASTISTFRVCLNSPLKKASLTGFHATAKHIAAKAVSPSSETMRTI